MGINDIWGRIRSLHSIKPTAASRSIEKPGPVVRILAAGSVLLSFAACTNLDPDPVRTQIVTYPKTARIFVNGTFRGTSPVVVMLPRDAKGNLEGTNVIRAVPVVPGIYAQTRRYVASDRQDPGPSRIMIDLREPDPLDPENFAP